MQKLTITTVKPTYTNALGIFDWSNEFIMSGQRKVEEATEIYNKYFSDESTEDINVFIHRQTL